LIPNVSKQISIDPREAGFDALISFTTSKDFYKNNNNKKLYEKDSVYSK
jgi:hypothetical protein